MRVALDSLRDGEGKTPLAVAVGRFKNGAFLQPPSAARGVEEDAATAVVRLLLACTHRLNSLNIGIHSRSCV